MSDTMQNSLSKRSVGAAIQGGYPQPQPQGLLGNARDPINMRARQEYSRYAIEAQQRGEPAMPFDAWMKQYMTTPQPQQAPSPGMMQQLRGLLGM